MNDVAADGATESAHAFERETLCFAKTEVGSVLRNGDEGYRERLQSLYSGAESIASDRLVKLKQRLRTAMGDEFWELLAEGVATISGAQYSFVSKRMITDDENLAVEMPPIGEPGSCLNAVAFYFNDGHGSEIRLRNMKYHAYSCPCAYMKHDKILIIPEGVSTLIPDNPNGLKVPVESYLGVPLFAEGKCFGHFGVMWSAEGIAKKKLGWAFLEMTFHALEDMILDRILNQPNFADGMMHNSQKPNRVVPHDAISVAQSLKPYARSLSHELRTPMQGVVGMLDVMHANVQEAAEDQKDPQVRKVFKELKENIEVVQDSARRAVEAADNVVHAYDMNMGVPEVPPVTNSKDMSDIRRRSISLKDNRPEIVVTGNNLAFNLRSGKRRRQSVQWANGKTPKRHRSDSEWSGRYPSTNDIESNPAKAAVSLMDAMAVAQATHSPDRMNCTTDSPPYSSERTVVPGLRHTSLHDVLRYIINDSLKVGGRPESAIAQETERGEVIEVMTRSPKGEEKTKVIEWSVDPLVPDSILIDERDLSKMVSCVVLNALKFTEEGKISILAKLSLRSRYITINVRDTGSGIPAAFLPNLFKAFSREDDSLTRQSEGLGLGLLVARGLSRKMGGDLFCVRSETSGPHKGTDFEIRVPLTPGEVCSRSGSPHSSPTPSMRSRHSHSADMDRGSTERGRSRHTPTPMIDHSKDMLRDHRIPYPTPAQISGTTPLAVPSPLPTSSPARRYSTPNRRVQKTPSDIDRNLARRHPLNILVAEDNKINRKLLVNMLRRLGYNKVREAYDGADAVRQWSIDRENGREIDVVLMDLWMPYMDGYEATEKILGMAADDDMDGTPSKIPTILAVTADVTDGALERAAKAGMKGFMTKPYKLIDLEKLIVEYCATRAHEDLL